MDLFDKFAPLQSAQESIDMLDTDPFGVRIEKIISPTEAIINGKPTILIGTHNYLGLTFDEDCMAAASKAALTEGTGTTGSRVANGTYPAHAAIEAELRDFFNCSGAMLFSTGYQANLGILAALVGPKDYVLIDADSHASIYDGCMMGSGTVIRFRHNDPDDLEKKLKRLEQEDSNKLIVVEGIYSMFGDTAPLTAFVELKEKYNAYLLVDEAHSVGVLGEHGRGLAEKLGLEDRVDFITGTFSKSLGAVGGFCVSNHPKFDILRWATRPYIFTASLPPSVVASGLTALRTMRARPDLKEDLWRNVDRLYSGLTDLGFRLGDEPSPVVAVILPDRDTAASFWQALLNAGVYCNLAIPPGTANNVFLLRCSLCAKHTEEQLRKVCEVFSEVGHNLGVLPDNQKPA